MHEKLAETARQTVVIQNIQIGTSFLSSVELHQMHEDHSHHKPPQHPALDNDIGNNSNFKTEVSINEPHL